MKGRNRRRTSRSRRRKSGGSRSLGYMVGQCSVRVDILKQNSNFFRAKIDDRASRWSASLTIHRPHMKVGLGPIP